jgi:phosphatidylglycerol lysyltransferase
VNLYSVMDDPLLPERAKILRQVFPLEFLHLSRSITLLIGLALVVSSINIYRRKRRAWKLTFLLAGAAVVFHLTKGLDYEEAAFSALLAALLLATRPSFTVGSGRPDFRGALGRLGAVLVAALGYGVLGFWLLDPKEFGVNFRLGDALHSTLRCLTLAGAPEVVPRTRYARWFLDSLSLITFAGISYSGFALFRPVLYVFRTHPRERALAAGIAREFGRDSQDFFKLFPDKSYFFSPRQDCFLAYRVGGSFAVVLGDPVGREESIADTVQEFAALCRDNGWSFGLYQVGPWHLPLYLRLGLKKLKVGDDAIVDLTQFSLEGGTGREFRGKIRQIEKLGIRAERYEPPVPETVLRQVKEVSDEWLRIPGRRERRFTLGLFDPHYLRSTTIFAARDAQGRMLAFLNLIPPYRRGETTADLMRRRTDAPNGVMDYLFVKLFLEEKQRGNRSHLRGAVCQRGVPAPRRRTGPGLSAVPVARRRPGRHAALPGGGAAVRLRVAGRCHRGFGDLRAAAGRPDAGRGFSGGRRPGRNGRVRLSPVSKAPRQAALLEAARLAGPLQRGSPADRALSFHLRRLRRIAGPAGGPGAGFLAGDRGLRVEPPVLGGRRGLSRRASRHRGAERPGQCRHLPVLHGRRAGAVRGGQDLRHWLFPAGFPGFDGSAVDAGPGGARAHRDDPGRPAARDRGARRASSRPAALSRGG